MDLGMTPTEFLPVLRELARCYQAFESYSAKHVRSMGLTPSQFDIIATLGNTPGMTFKQLGEKTLITKGTLTGVIDRLAAKRLVQREASPDDGRSQIVKLTARGNALFARIFPEHLDHISNAFAGASADELQKTLKVLKRLTALFKQETES
jgi:MarR family 2-MHQ and catechol resistance regulon transcriptional repressor